MNTYTIGLHIYIQPHTSSISDRCAVRLAGDAVTADADGGHGADRVKDLVKHGLQGTEPRDHLMIHMDMEPYICIYACEPRI